MIAFLDIDSYTERQYALYLLITHATAYIAAMELAERCSTVVSPVCRPELFW